MEKLFFAKDAEPNGPTDTVSWRRDFIHRCEDFVAEMNSRFVVNGLIVTLTSGSEPPQIAFRFSEEIHAIFLTAWEEALPRFGIKLR